MKKRLYAFIGFLFAVATLFAYWQVSAVLPHKLEIYTKASLQNILGTAYFDYESKETGLTRLSFRQVKLDKDGFNRIEQINIRYSPLSLFFTGTISEIDVLVPDITVAINESNIHASIQRILGSPAPKWLYALDTLGVEGGRVNLLTQNMGALRIGFEGLIRSTDQGKSAQFQLHAAQKQLSGDLQLSGTLHENRNWHIDGILTDGRLDHNLLQLTRMTGQMTLDSAGDEGYYAESEISIGGLRTSSGHAVSEVAASYELNQTGYNFVAGGKALGFDDIELGLAYDSRNADIVTGTIFTPTLPDLIKYYKGERDILSGVDHGNMLKNIFLTYELPVNELWRTQKQILLRFMRLDIADFAPLFNGDFYGNGLLHGAVKVRLSEDNIVFGGLAIRSHNGNFVLGKPALKSLSQKIKNTPSRSVLLEQAGEFHFETLVVSVTGADSQTENRNITIKIRGADSKTFTFAYKDDLLWLWNALLGAPKD